MKKAAATLLSLAALALAASAQAKVVNIGYSGPLSGGAASYGKDVQSGILMAIDEINTAGGITVKGEKVTFNLVSLDDRYLPNETATNVKRLTSQGVSTIFVPHAGGILTVQAGSPALRTPLYRAPPEPIWENLPPSSSTFATS